MEVPVYFILCYIVTFPSSSISTLLMAVFHKSSQLWHLYFIRYFLNHESSDFKMWHPMVSWFSSIVCTVSIGQPGALVTWSRTSSKLMPWYTFFSPRSLGKSARRWTQTVRSSVGIARRNSCWRQHSVGRRYAFHTGVPHRWRGTIRTAHMQQQVSRIWMEPSLTFSLAGLMNTTDYESKYVDLYFRIWNMFCLTGRCDIKHCMIYYIMSNRSVQFKTYLWATPRFQP